MPALQERNIARSTPGLVSQGLLTSQNPTFMESRFGKIRINLDKALFFANGLLGLPDKMHFCLADFPDVAFNQFKLLQSLDDAELSFITLPLDDDGQLPSYQFLEKKDLEQALGHLGIAKEDIAILLITTVHRSLNQKEFSLSVNVRAPLFIDTSKNIATQYVFQNNKYQIRHMLDKAL